MIARPRDGALHRALNAEKPLARALAVGLGNAGAVIDHAQDGLAPFLPGPHRDVTAHRHMHECVVQQVGQRLGQLPRVAQHRGLGTGQGVHAQIDAALAGQWPEVFGDAFSQCLQIDRGHVQVHGVGAGEGEHLVGLADGVVHLLLDGAQRIFTLAGVVLAQGKTHLGRQCGERRAQLVGCIVDKPALRFNRAAIAAGVLVDGIDQRAHIGGHRRSVHRGQVIAAARRHFVAQTLQRPHGHLHR